MTGFGQASAQNERFRVTVTLRGVNHRYLDLQLRGCEERREVETAVRDLLSERLWRGRVEAVVEVLAVGARHAEVRVDEEQVRAIRGLCDELSGRGLISPDLALVDLLRFPEVVRLEVEDPEWSPADRELLATVTGEAVEQMVTARRTEGGKLRRILEERLDALLEVVCRLDELHEGIAGEVAAGLRRRIGELMEGAVPDEDRLAQEVAFLADRSDVTEELDRLRSHLDHFRVIMAADGSVGKRLDFLAQEIFRELNTIGSKCRDSDMTRQVLEGKSLCEQIREQLQNVE